MTTVRRIALLAMAVIFVTQSAAAQSADVPRTGTSGSPADPADVPDAKAWSCSAYATTYVLPDEGNYVQPTFTADRGWLHLEARYNYEGLRTGSAWVGYNFGGGETVEWEVTPMVGGVFGDTTGIAVGSEASLTWKKLELYTEGEYFIDPGGRADNFLYNWSEVTLAPREWFRFGLVTQRTRAYASDRVVERGLLAGFTIRRLEVTGNLLIHGDSKPTFIVSAGVSFD